MILSGKPFNLSSLILKKMVGTVEKAHTGIPYAQFLTKVFQGNFKVDLKSATSITLRDVFYQKTLTQNNLQLENREVSRILTSPPFDSTPEIGEPSNPTPVASDSGMLLLRSLQTDSMLNTGQLLGLSQKC